MRGLNTEKYGPEETPQHYDQKRRPEETPYLDTFHAVCTFKLSFHSFSEFPHKCKRSIKITRLRTTKLFPLLFLSIVVPFCGSTVLAKRALGTLSRHISTTMTSSPSCTAIPQLQETV